MKLTDDQRNQLLNLGRRMVAITEQYKEKGFTFDAAIQFFRSNTVLAAELMAFMQPYITELDSILIEYGQTSALYLCKKHKLKQHIQELNTMVHEISAVVFNDEMKAQIEDIFRGSPIRSINVQENPKETQIRNGYGLFEPPAESHVYEYSVTFADDTMYLWHTLRAGDELNRMKSEYESHIPAEYVPIRMATL